MNKCCVWKSNFINCSQYWRHNYKYCHGSLDILTTHLMSESEKRWSGVKPGCGPVVKKARRGPYKAEVCLRQWIEQSAWKQRPWCSRGWRTRQEALWTLDSESGHFLGGLGNVTELLRSLLEFIMDKKNNAFTSWRGWCEDQLNKLMWVIWQCLICTFNQCLLNLTLNHCEVRQKTECTYKWVHLKLL